MNLIKRIKKIIYFFSILSISILLISIALSSYISEKKPKNIILISIDTLRADHLGIYGYKAGTSPNIDKFAKESIIFTNAIAQASWTPPSLASILSSTNPTEHGVINWDSLYNPKVKFLGEIASQLGFQTAFITNHPSLSLENLGINKGFQKKIILTNNSNRANEVAELSIKWLSKERKYKMPFVLWIHFFDPHEPFTPSEPFATKFLQNLNEDNFENIPICKEEFYFGLNCISPYIVQQGINNIYYYTALYDAEIAEVDDAIGNLLNYIKKAKLLNNSIIIITSDHGEIIKKCSKALNQCIYFSHGTFLYQELIRIPLILHMPNEEKQIIKKEPIASIDILPTLFYLLGLPRVDSFQGINFFSTNKNINRKIMSFEMRNHWSTVIFQEWKLINHLHEAELFNLKNDPQEEYNLSSSIQAKDLVKILKTYSMKNMHQNYNKEIVLDNAYREKLNALGYLDQLH